VAHLLLAPGQGRVPAQEPEQGRVLAQVQGRVLALVQGLALVQEPAPVPVQHKQPSIHLPVPLP